MGQMDFKDQKVIPIGLQVEMKRSYIDYAMSVIVGRALPDVRDGMKPVHRRIMYGMYEMGMTPDKPFKKSARIVGDVMGKYHPHGDASIYDAMVRMAHDFSIRYPLVQGHGNFGSVDGDSPAAMRYTEARLSSIAMEMLADIDKDTITMGPNYDESMEEPLVLPAKVPNLLLNGSAGIAVAMATNIPPHNLTEVVNGCIAMIEKPEITSEELIDHVSGPDFPTGGIILGRDGIRDAYTTGRGSVRIRSVTEIEEIGHGKSAIIIRELPYMVNKATLIEKIAELVQNKDIAGISDLRDESDREGMRVVIELKRDAIPQVVLNNLFKRTAMETSFGVNMVALVGLEPKLLTLREVLHHYLEHRFEVVTRRTAFELGKAKDRVHILEGLLVAQENLDPVIKLIRAAKATDEAKKGLMEKFSLSELQAQAILEMQLRRLTGLEREKIESEHKELKIKITEYEGILADKSKVYAIIKAELLEIRENYGDDRRTEIIAAREEMTEEDFIANKPMAVFITSQGYIKRLPLDTFERQLRGGRGVTGMETRRDDDIEHFFTTMTHSTLLCFTEKGVVYAIKVYQVPEASRQAKGVGVVNLLPISTEEKITAVIPIEHFVENQYLLMLTQNGVTKKTDLVSFSKIRSTGIIAIDLDEGDKLRWVRLTNGTMSVILGTRKGLSIHFSEEDVRALGRTARGVRAITLREKDELVDMDVIPRGDHPHVLVVTTDGYGKRTSIDEYRLQSRGGVGIQTISPKKGRELAALRTVKETDELIIATARGTVIRQNVSGISELGRSTQGVRLQKMDGKDEVCAVAKIIRFESAGGEEGPETAELFEGDEEQT